MRVSWLRAMLAIAALAGLHIAPAHSKGRTAQPRTCSGMGSIQVTGWSLDLNVTVTDPVGRFARLADTDTCTIPGCEIGQATGTHDVTDSTDVASLDESWNFHFRELVEGLYTIRIEATDDDTAHVFVERSTQSSDRPWKVARAELGAFLKKG